MAKKKRKRTGPKEERLKIDMDWKDAAKIVINSKPAPKVKKERG